MIKKNLAVLIFLAGSVIAAGSLVTLHAESVEIMNQKIMLEAQMESRLRQTLSSFLGTNNIIAVVKISLIEKGEKGKPGQDVSMRKWDENQEMVLPGVPATASMTKAGETVKDESRLGVSRINISVIIGKSLSAEAVEKVKKLVANAFGLNADAGDTLTVETYAATEDYFGAKVKDKLFNVSEIILLSGLGIAGIFLFGPFKNFLRNFNETLPKIGSAGGNGPRQKEGDPDIPDLPDDEENTRDKEEENIPEPQQRIGLGGFGGIFGQQDDGMSLGKIINKDTIEDLRLVLSVEPPEVIAKVIQRLPAEFALAAVPPAKMAEVVARFSSTSFEQPEEIKAIMARVKSRVEWSYGGAVKLGRMLQVMDKQSQEAVLANLKAFSPDFAAKVEGRLFRFTDLLNYDDASIKRIFRKAGAEAFSRCIKDLPDETAQLFYGKLGTSISALVNNHLKTMVAGGTTGDHEIKILQAVDGLVRKGFLPPLEQVKQQPQ